MLKSLLLIAFFVCSNAITISSLSKQVVVGSAEIDTDGSEVVFVNKSGLFKVEKDDSCEQKIREILKENFDVLPKIKIFKNRIFLNKADGDFCAYDFSGSEIFSAELDGSSRSEICVDEKYGNLIFALTNQAILCFSFDGNLIYYQNEYVTNNIFVNNKIMVQDKVYFATSNSFLYFDKAILGDTVEFRNTKFDGFYLDSGILYAFDKKLCYKISNNVLEKLDDVAIFSKGHKHNLNFKGVNFDLENFVFEDGVAVGFSGKNLVIINGKDVLVDSFDFEIDKVIYKKGKLILVSGKNIRIASVEI